MCVVRWPSAVWTVSWRVKCCRSVGSVLTAIVVWEGGDVDRTLAEGIGEYGAEEDIWA